MITAKETISAFTNKLLIWINRIGSGNYANFSKLDTDFDVENSLPIVTEMMEHLQVLIQSFKVYFQHEEVSVFQQLIKNLFLFNLDSMNGNDKIKENPVGMKSRNKIKI